MEISEFCPFPVEDKRNNMRTPHGSVGLKMRNVSSKMRKSGNRCCLLGGQTKASDNYGMWICRREISLYEHISMIVWQHDQKHRIKGVVSDTARSDIRPFDFDPEEDSDFDIVNEIWALIAWVSLTWSRGLSQGLGLGWSRLYLFTLLHSIYSSLATVVVSYETRRSIRWCGFEQNSLFKVALRTPHWTCIYSDAYGWVLFVFLLVSATGRIFWNLDICGICL